MLEELDDKDDMKMQPTKFGGSPSPGFGGGFGSGSSAFGMGPGPGMMSGGAKASLSLPSVSGVNKGVLGVGLLSLGFGDESGPDGGMPAMMKGKQSSTFGSSFPLGLGAGGERRRIVTQPRRRDLMTRMI